MLLLKPVAFPANGSNNSTNPGRRPGTRWAFEKSVVLVENTTKSSQASTAAAATAAATAAAAAATPRPESAAPLPTKRGGAPGGALSEQPAAHATRLDPTAYARRSAKLDRRVEIRTDPNNPGCGRGLFAMRDVPAGTEVMRVRAAGAVVRRQSPILCCCRCFVSDGEGVSFSGCRGCRLPVCTRCQDGSNGEDAHRATCSLSRASLEILLNTTVDQAVLCLSADILARKKAGLIDDEEWDLFNSLEHHENEARSIGLGASDLQKCVYLFKTTMGLDVSKEDVQTVYRRVVRNAHTVCPNGASVRFGNVQALFACGALVNHSCRPNSFSHCVTRPSARGPVLEQVLRATRDVQAGEEISCSYLSDYVGVPVADRRELLEVWGFRCACARCLLEEGEDISCKNEAQPENGDARRLLVSLTEKFATYAWPGRRTGAPISTNNGNRDAAKLVESSAMFLGDDSVSISPRLRTILAVSTLELALVACPGDPNLRFHAYLPAIKELRDYRDPQAIRVLIQYHIDGLKLAKMEGTRSSRYKPYMDIAMKAFDDAVDLCSLCFGSQHRYTINMRHDAAQKKKSTKLP